jgi:trans-2,3-dihydro-3-hydroxyanthranilate isomerase
VPLEGNPVAVFIDGAGVGGEVMQRTARELNLSETVFLLPPDNDRAHARVRIFTPTAELPFAGHPILGAAFVVGERVGVQRIQLQTSLGLIPVALTRDGDRIVFGEMQQPIPTAEPFQAREQLLAALGMTRSELPVLAYRNGPVHVYVMLESEAQVSALRPDPNALAALGEYGFSCFARADSGFRTRMFAPALGVAEDPATGSAAGPLALHLARHGQCAFGEQIAIRQGSEIGRPSLLYARVEGNVDRVERVVVGGAAVIVAHGEYRLS